MRPGYFPANVTVIGGGRGALRGLLRVIGIRGAPELAWPPEAAPAVDRVADLRPRARGAVRDVFLAGRELVDELQDGERRLALVAETQRVQALRRALR